MNPNEMTTSVKVEVPDYSLSPENEHAKQHYASPSTTECRPSQARFLCDKLDVERLPFEDFPRNVCPKHCAVCGSAATGYHYEAPSCNGCKTFFRRTVISGNKYECKYTLNCLEQRPRSTRTTCRACRFKKCQEAGMKSYAVNLCGRNGSNQVASPAKRTLPVCQDQNLATTSGIQQISDDISTVENQMQRLVDQLLYLEIKTDRFRKSSFNPNPYKIPSLEHLLQRHSELGTSDNVKPMPDWPLPNLSAPPKWEENRKDWFTFDLLLTVEYSKTFFFFNKLDPSDKVLLLKSSALMCMNLTQAFFSYANKSNVIVHPDETKMFSPLPGLGATGSAFEQAKTRAIEPLIRNKLTKEEYVLLKAIMLCNPSVPDLSSNAVQLLTMEKLRLSNTLCSYCLAKFGTAGPARYASTLALVDTLTHVVKFEKDFHLLLQIMNKSQKEIAYVTELLS